MQKNDYDEKRLRDIFEVLETIAKDKQIVLPLHPRTKKILENLQIGLKNLTVIEPVGYLEMVWLINHCGLVMTDSGGLQKEAFFFEKPCITLRDETEWVELVENKFNVLVGADKDKIQQVHDNHDNLFEKIYGMDLYGGGTASKNIIETLKK